MNSRISTVALIAALLALGSVMVQTRTATEKKETAYERVLRVRTLRCGYMLFPPVVTADPNTKKLGGMNVDYAEAMASALGIKITWQEIVIGQQVEALRSGRVDAMCAGEGPLLANTTLYLHYSEPLAYVPLHMYVRADDKRFDGRFAGVGKKANDPSLKVAVMDGDVTQDFAARLFPLAKRHELPQTADYSQIYTDVADGKADFVINDPFTSGDFMKNNPGRLRKVDLDKPFAVLPLQMSVLRGEEALAGLLSQGIVLLRDRGIEDGLMAKAERDYPGGFYRVQQRFTTDRGESR